ncbi:hypothetical protein CAEBREN_22898 [Caenorhabditis brenneri]|uniref:Uncharacterized protein n=1 Tax=Caenorhabditis brenneri TaxID=135651 RepID=G0MQA3_CAEBE|nr:hypothetical protein CAEBREN_22898 [Caenorhabditis brenneri]
MSSHQLDFNDSSSGIEGKVTLTPRPIVNFRTHDGPPDWIGVVEEVVEQEEED